jgi:hypothetical protein
VTVAGVIVGNFTSVAVTVTEYVPTRALLSVYTDTSPLVGSMVNSGALRHGDVLHEIVYWRSPQKSTPLPDPKLTLTVSLNTIYWV